MQLQRIVVTGIGTITPIGNTLKEFDNNLFLGKSGANLITKFDTTLFKTKFACEIKNYNPLDFFDKKELKKFDLFTQYAIISSTEAIQNSKLLNTPNLNKNRVGVIWSSGIGGIQSLQNEILDFYKNGKNPRYLSPFLVIQMISNIAAGQIAIQHQFNGLNFGITAACASSANAIIDAVNNIQLNKADAIIVGGSEAAITEIGIGSFNAMKALSENNANYQMASCPYDKNRDGFVMGEGAGALVVESLEHAQKRNANILAEIVGTGMSADAYHLVAPNPTGNGAKLAMENALENAQLLPKNIDYINAHGTATPLGDIAEIKAIESIFGNHIYDINISATKSMTGHLLGAAGAIETIASILAIQNQSIPPTINLVELDDSLDSKINFTLHKKQNKKVAYVLTNNFAFGGQNTCIILKNWNV